MNDRELADRLAVIETHQQAHFTEIEKLRSRQAKMDDLLYSLMSGYINHSREIMVLARPTRVGCTGSQGSSVVIRAARRKRSREKQQSLFDAGRSGKK